jgi:hypothetical protein
LKCRSLYTGIGGGFLGGEKGSIGGFMDRGGDGGAIRDMVLPPSWKEAAVANTEWRG